MGPRTVEPTDDATRIRTQGGTDTPDTAERLNPPHPLDPLDRRLLEEAEAALSGPGPLPAPGHRRRSAPVLPLWAKIVIFIATVAALLVLFPPGAS